MMRVTGDGEVLGVKKQREIFLLHIGEGGEEILADGGATGGSMVGNRRGPQ